MRTCVEDLEGKLLRFDFRSVRRAEPGQIDEALGFLVLGIAVAVKRVLFQHEISTSPPRTREEALGLAPSEQPALTVTLPQVAARHSSVARRVWRAACLTCYLFSSCW